MWDVAKKLPVPVEYLHVKRAFNAFADYMGRLARDLGRTVSLCDVPHDVLALHSSPAPAGGHFFAIPVARSDVELEQMPCAVCGGAGAPEATLICDLCGQPRHVQCAGLQSVPRGFWYCPSCLEVIARGEIVDVTVDLALMGYLFRGELPPDVGEVARIQRAARFLVVLGDVLYTTGRDNHWREVPAISDRWGVMASVHGLAHCGAQALYDTLRKSYFWRGMRLDCVDFVRQCLACARERAVYKPHDNLTPIFKELVPFRAWSIDLMPSMPEGSQG